MKKNLKRFVIIAIIFAVIFLIVYFTQKYPAEGIESKEISIPILVILWFITSALFYVCYNAFANYNEKRYKIAEENSKIRQAEIKLAEKILERDSRE